MNNRVIFAIGVLAGAGIGSVATYFALKRHFEDIVDQEIDDYASKCAERIEDIVSYYEGGKDAEETLEEDSDEENVPEPEEYRHNEGVKKYHHYANTSDGNVQSIFSKDNVKEVAGAVRFKTDEERSDSRIADRHTNEEKEKVTEGQKDILERPQLEDITGIEEDITEDEFDALSDDEYTKVYLQYDVNEDKLLTNEGEIAEEAYAKLRHELIGNCWRWATDYVDKGDMFYVQNDNLKIAFAVEVSFDPDKEMVEV